MKRKLQKIISVLVFFTMLFAAIPVLAVQEKGDKVTLIVEVEGDALLKNDNLSAFIESKEAKEEEEHLLSTQAVVKSNIERTISKSVDEGFTYTSVFNGFSMKAYLSDIQKIKAIDGVKNVYVSQTYEVPPEPETDELIEDVEPEVGASMMNVESMYEKGYDGRGQAVAIIDNGFDTGHMFFSSDIIDPKFSKEDVKNFLENHSLNINVSANQVYKNSKIPFAYDYACNDADTFSEIGSHGTHVAGIVAGKNGYYQGTTFSGMAPEAQLILMKVGDDDGILSDDSMLAAFDDIAKMDVCSVNYSIGRPATEDKLLLSAIKVLRDAGIAVMCSEGNDDRSHTEATQPDYIYPDVPALSNDITAVASIAADRIWVMSQKITLGNGETIVYEADDNGFFERFSQEPIPYILFDSREELLSQEDIYNKIWICSDLMLDQIIDLLRENPIPGAIILMNGEEDQDGGNILGNIPAIIMRDSVKENFAKSDINTLQTNPEKEYSIRKNEAKMSYFTSWATLDPFNLKPDVTAPGGSILSSVPNDEFENMSGTSMASPHVAGAATLMNSFMSEKYPDISGKEKVELMQNLMMSSAQIVFQNEKLPESPRRQGAGLVDLDAATKVPVILKGSYGKSSLSLGDKLENNITLSFVAENLSDEDVTYDNISFYVFTDNYEERDGKNYITDSVALDFTTNAQQSYVIPAKSSQNISVTIQLDENQVNQNLSIFKNGFWVDGYIIFDSKDKAVQKCSMPFTGFYGDWTAFDAFQPNCYEGGDNKIVGYDQFGITHTLGTNYILESMLEIGTASPEDYNIEEYNKEEFCGVAPDTFEGGVELWLYMLRSLTNCSFTITNSNGEDVFALEDFVGICRGPSDINYPITIGTDYPEGNYTINVKGTVPYPYDNENLVKEQNFKLYIDKTKPKITQPKIYSEDNKQYASFTASDNFHLMGYTVLDKKKILVMEPINGLSTTDIVVDITGADLDSLEFVVFDYACNSKEFTIGKVSASLAMSPVITDQSVSFVLNISNTDADIDADVIAAVYAEDGKLLDVKLERQFLSSGQSIVKSFDFNGIEHYKYIRVFIWRHGKMFPLIEPLEIIE